MIPQQNIVCIFIFYGVISMSSGSFTGKQIFISGASGDIGRKTAEVFAKEGANLYLTGFKNADLLKEYAGDLSEKHGILCRVFSGDLSDPDTVRNIFSEIKSLDLMINCAGAAYTCLLQDMSDDDWKRVTGADLDSVFYCCRSAIPLFLKQGSGKIINISSVWGNTGAAAEAAYSAAKGGVNALTKALAKELAPSGIAVNALAFGLIDTKMNFCYSKEELEAVIEEIPADRAGSVSEAAAAILHLAQMPEYLTGQVITMDGGWT